MSKPLEQLNFVNSHEWVSLDGEGVVTVGISEHAQNLLGDVVFVELPEPGATLAANEPAAVVKSIEGASDIYSPVSGEVVEVNEALVGEPGTVNADPYGAGWLFRIRSGDDAELAHLLSAESCTGML